MQIKHNILLFILITVFASSCLKDRSSFPPPKLPNKQIFELNNIFIISELDDDITDTVYRNWSAYYNKVVIWNNFFNNYLSLHKNALDVIYKTQPIFFANNTWLRKKDFIYKDANYQANMYSTNISNDTVFWELLINKGDEKPVTYISGYTFSENLIGEWVFVNNLVKSFDLLKISWSNSASTSLVTYQNAYTESMSYKYSTEVKYLQKDLPIVHIEMLDRDKNTLSETAIDQINKSGKIKNEHYFSDTLWHCWDKNLKNITCE